MRLPFAVIALSLFFSVSSVALAQPKKPKANNEEADAEAAQQRTVAISLVTSLADEARSFKDQTRRARVQARAADVLWDTDPERARVDQHEPGCTHEPHQDGGEPVPGAEQPGKPDLVCFGGFLGCGRCIG